jgi:hypothetical protein
MKTWVVISHSADYGDQLGWWIGQRVNGESVQVSESLAHWRRCVTGKRCPSEPRCVCLWVTSDWVVAPSSFPMSRSGNLKRKIRRCRGWKPLAQRFSPLRINRHVGRRASYSRRPESVLASSTALTQSIVIRGRWDQKSLPVIQHSTGRPKNGDLFLTIW